MLYALGAYNEYAFLYPIDTVKMTIIQPRLDSISEEDYENIGGNKNEG